MGNFGVFAAWVGILASILAIPFSIAANLLTPKVSNWWARKSKKRAEHRVYVLQNRLRWIREYNTDAMRHIHYIIAIRYIVYLVAAFFYGAVVIIALALQWIERLSRYATIGGNVFLVALVVFITILLLKVLRSLNLASERYLLQQDIGIQAQLSRLYEITEPSSSKRAATDAEMSRLARSVTKPPSKQPKLERVDFATVGMPSEGQQLGFDAPKAFAFMLRNSEDRFETHAHNLKASVLLKSADGKEVKIEEAAWFKNEGAKGRCYRQTATIGMLEIAGVVCVIRDGNKFYAALYSDQERVRSGAPLGYGQWDLHISVEGDNVLSEYQGRLQLLPNNSIGFVPLNKASTTE
jgi:hypothetical protein